MHPIYMYKNSPVTDLDSPLESQEVAASRISRRTAHEGS
jgi:hypothetical protein